MALIKEHCFRLRVDPTQPMAGMAMSDCKLKQESFLRIFFARWIRPFIKAANFSSITWCVAIPIAQIQLAELEIIFLFARSNKLRAMPAGPSENQRAATTNA
jgi:hypothetical protein